MGITKKAFEDYKKNRKRLNALETEMRLMKSTDIGFGNDVIFDYRQGYPKPESIVGFDQEKYDRKRQQYETKLKQIQEVDDYIENIADDEIRLVFTLYYINGKTWDEVADEMSYSDDSYPRKCIRDKYFTDNSIK